MPTHSPHILPLYESRPSTPTTRLPPPKMVHHADPLHAWPPALTAPQLASLSAQATDYALAHGLIYRPIGPPPSSTHAHHAPIALLPSPFPKGAFLSAISLQPILNELYARVALDDAFLQQVIGGNVAKVDDFQRSLWEVYQTVKKEGREPEYHLGLFRSDYLLHSDPSSSARPTLKQVEFNTISSSFGPLCAKVCDLHHHLFHQTRYYGAASPSIDDTHLPQNTALSTLAHGLAEAHRAYVSHHHLHDPAPRILFVVQEQERNAFDQRALEYELMSKWNIRSVRRTFTSLIRDAKVDLHSSTRKLTVTTEENPSEQIEISTVYYRSAYAPTDYPTADYWKLRLNLERSSAIKCPTVALQLAGAKKVQQVLAEPGVVESFLPEGDPNHISWLKSTWTRMYPLEETSELGKLGLQLALNPATAQSYVMKPQREGGGNNIYRGDIPLALQEMAERDTRRPAGQPKEHEGYILMELIQPPTGLGNYLLRPPTGTPSDHTLLTGKESNQHHEGLTTAECRLSPDVVSELGIYGVALFKRRDNTIDEQSYFSQPPASIIMEENPTAAAAYLLRTKGRESDEGGVAVGFSVLDSVMLV